MSINKEEMRQMIEELEANHQLEISNLRKTYNNRVKQLEERINELLTKNLENKFDIKGNKFAKKFFEEKITNLFGYIDLIEQINGIKNKTLEELKKELQKERFYAGSSHNPTAYSKDISEAKRKALIKTNTNLLKGELNNLLEIIELPKKVYKE
jgi:hypothetical protein